MKLQQYANNQIKVGKFAHVGIVSGEFGTFWLETEDYKTIEGACFTSRERAEKARTNAIEKAVKRFA